MTATGEAIIEEKAGYCTLCRSRCGTVNLVQNGRLVGVKPNPAHPTGRALCPKGRAAPEIAHSARRLTTPLRRTSPKSAADPAFVPISWDEALREIAAKLDQFRSESGPESVVFGVTSGSSSSISDSLDWVQRFIRTFGSPNTVFSTEICNWHKDNAHIFTFGCGLPTADYQHSDLILLWGHNPANVWLAQADAIGAAQARGAKLVVIDPRRTGNARNADLWLRVRPGTDAVLALGVARLLIERDAYDEDFVRKWTNAPFLVREDNGHFLRGRDLGWEDAECYVVIDGASGRPVSSTEATYAQLSGVQQAGPIACRTAFDHYRAAAAPYDPATVERITGIPAAQVEAFADLAGAAGSVCYHGWTGVGQHTNATQTERAIATLYALTGSFDAPGGNVRMPALPVPALHSMAMIPPETRAKALGLDKRPLGPPTDGWITSTDFYDAVLNKKPYPVRAFFAFGSNILISHPAPERGRAALEALEFQVHCDLFLNPTAETADIVLPVSSPWEHEALRIGFEITPEAQGHVQLRPQIIPRQGEARSDMWIVFQLAQRLGMGDAFFGGDIEAGFRHLLSPLGLDLETLRASPEGICLPLVQEHRKYRKTGFATETGKAELYSEKLLRHRYPPVPQYTPPAEAPGEDFPLTLLSANNGYFCHSQQRGIVSLRRRRPEPLAELHPDLASRYAIADGGWMRIGTRLGSTRVRAKFNDALAPDVVASDYGWWQSAPDLGLPGYARGESFNALIDENARDPVSGALGMRSFACIITPEADLRWPGWRSFTVTHRTQETPDVVVLRFAPADGGKLPAYQPGQYVRVRAGAEVRSYSLIGSGLREASEYRIGVRHIEGGRLSSELAERLKPGDRVELEAPAGSFRMPLDDEFPVVLIAGGIGITPFMSYLEALAEGAGSARVTLYHGCRDASHQPFTTRIEELAQRLPNFDMKLCLSRPGPDDVCSKTGRLNAGDIDPALIQARARFYICASDAMTDAMIEGLKARGVPPFEIFKERFLSPEPPPPDGLEPRTIRLARSGRTLTWTPGESVPTILNCVERNGLPLPSGCRTGQCESCAVDILSGTVRHLVETADLDEGVCLTCQAIPTSDLVLDA